MCESALGCLHPPSQARAATSSSVTALVQNRSLLSVAISSAKCRVGSAESEPSKPWIRGVNYWRLSRPSRPRDSHLPLSNGVLLRVRAELTPRALQWGARLPSGGPLLGLSGSPPLLAPPPRYLVMFTVPRNVRERRGLGFRSSSSGVVLKAQLMLWHGISPCDLRQEEGITNSTT